nr:phage tail assembly protein [Escherichia coli]
MRDARRLVMRRARSAPGENPGYPYQMNQDESVRLLAHVVSKYIVRLAKVPQSSVDQMSPADLNAAAWLVAGFFLQA